MFGQKKHLSKHQGQKLDQKLYEHHRLVELLDRLPEVE